MSGWSAVRWTGVLGLAAIVAQLAGAVAGSVAGTVPAFDDPNKILAFAKDHHLALTSVSVLFIIGFTLFIGFLAGLRAIAATAAPHHEWLATAMFGAGIAITLIALVQPGLALAADAIAVSNHADAAQVRLIFEVETMLGGAPWLVPSAFFLGAAGSLGAVTKILPRWLALAGWIGSVIALIASFASYGGSDPKAFWSGNGLVTILAFLPYWVWTVGASVVFLRRKESAASLHP